MRSSRKIGLVCLLRDEFVPGIPVSVEGSVAVAVNLYLVTAEDKRRGLVLVADLERVLEPVLNIFAPLRALN